MASGGASSGGAAGSSFDGGGYPSTGGTTPGSGGGSGSSGGASTGGTGSGGSPPANGCGQEPPCSRGATCCISGYSETASRCRPAAECTGAVRRSCSGHSECPGQRCCLSGAVVVRDILTNPVTDGDLKCQPACGSGEAPVECLNAGQCGQGQQCCVYSSGNPLAATTILRSECAAVCQGGRAICRSDAECAQGQTCDGISVMVGAHFCTD